MTKLKAKEYFESGYNCAESVAMGVLETVSGSIPDYFPKIASGFGGGFGRTRVELCGALAGGGMAIGVLKGRMGEQTDIKAKELTGLLHQKFIEKYKDTHCQPLLDQFEPQENSEKCALLVHDVAEMVVEILNPEIEDSQ